MTDRIGGRTTDQLLEMVMGRVRAYRDAKDRNAKVLGPETDEVAEARQALFASLEELGDAPEQGEGTDSEAQTLESALPLTKEEAGQQLSDIIEQQATIIAEVRSLTNCPDGEGLLDHLTMHTVIDDPAPDNSYRVWHWNEVPPHYREVIDAIQTEVDGSLHVNVEEKADFVVVAKQEKQAEVYDLIDRIAVGHNFSALFNDEVVIVCCRL